MKGGPKLEHDMPRKTLLVDYWYTRPKAHTLSRSSLGDPSSPNAGTSASSTGRTNIDEEEAEREARAFHDQHVARAFALVPERKPDDPPPPPYSLVADERPVSTAVPQPSTTTPILAQSSDALTQPTSTPQPAQTTSPSQSPGQTGSLNRLSAPPLPPRQPSTSVARPISPLPPPNHPLSALGGASRPGTGPPPPSTRPSSSTPSLSAQVHRPSQSSYGIDSSSVQLFPLGSSPPGLLAPDPAGRPYQQLPQLPLHPHPHHANSWSGSSSPAGYPGTGGSNSYFTQPTSNSSLPPAPPPIPNPPVPMPTNSFKNPSQVPNGYVPTAPQVSNQPPPLSGPSPFQQPSTYPAPHPHPHHAYTTGPGSSPGGGAPGWSNGPRTGAAAEYFNSSFNTGPSQGWQQQGPIQAEYSNFGYSSAGVPGPPQQYSAG